MHVIDTYDPLHRYNIFRGTIYDPEPEISFILLLHRDVKYCRYDAKYRSDARFDRRLDTRLIQMFPCHSP